MIIHDLLSNLPDGEVLDVRIGLHWTAVVVDTADGQRCGLASTLFVPHGHGTEFDVPQAGELTSLSASQLAEFALREQPTQACLGIAAINALLRPEWQEFTDANAEEMLAKHGAGKNIVLVGRFPFVPRIKPLVRNIIVLEQEPGPEDLPAELAPKYIPEADVVAITAMTLANHTLDGLLQLCSPKAFVMLLGPSTPLSPVLFKYGISLLSGSVVTNIEAVLRVVTQGGTFRQVHRAGVRLVNWLKTE